MGLPSLLGFGADMIQTSSANSWNRKNIEFQREENQKNRDYNHAEAELARNFQADFAREMFEKTTQYNSPANQVSMLRAAGLNPALAYSGGNFSPASMPSVSATSASSSGGITPTPYNTFDGLGSALAIQRQAAEIDNINADTRQKNAQGTILESNAKFADALNQGSVDLQHLQIDLGKKNIELSDSQISKLRADVDYLNKQIEAFDKQVQLLDVQIDSGKLDIESKKIENFYKSKEYEAILDKYAADASLSRAQAHSILSKLPYEIEKLGADKALSDALAQTARYQGAKYTWETRQIRLNLQDSQDYYDFMNGKAGEIGKTVNGMAQFLGRITGAFFPFGAK